MHVKQLMHIKSDHLPQLGWLQNKNTYSPKCPQNKSLHFIFLYTWILFKRFAIENDISNYLAKNLI